MPPPVQPPGVPIPPPNYQLPWGDLRGPQTWLTPQAYGFLQLLWQAVAGGGSVSVGDASEDLAGNAMVNIFDAGGGVFEVRNADADDPLMLAHGYMVSPAAMGETAIVGFRGVVSGQTGLLPGLVYLSPTAGGVTQTAPTTPGQIVQTLGPSVSATAFNFAPQPSVLL